MKTIEKTTRDGGTQIFEIITSKKELREFIKDAFWYSRTCETGIWEDEDSNVSFYDINGKCHCFFLGDRLTSFNVSNITKLVSDNGSTIVIYGDVPIDYNKHYGDWEVNL